MNRINVIGNMTADPIERKVGEHKVASFTVAESVGSGDKKTTQYFRVTAWNKIADVVLNYSKKGTKVFVSGPLKMTVNEKDGVKYYNNEIGRADDFVLLSPPDGTSRGANKQATTQVAPTPEHEEDDNLPF